MEPAAKPVTALFAGHRVSIHRFGRSPGHRSGVAPDFLRAPAGNATKPVPTVLYETVTTLYRDDTGAATYSKRDCSRI